MKKRKTLESTIVLASQPLLKTPRIGALKLRGATEDLSVAVVFWDEGISPELKLK